MENKNKILKEIIEWILCVLIAIVVALLLKYYVVTPTIVKQTSMYPTLVENEKLVLNRTINKSDLKRGDIVTFESPSKTNVDASEVDLSNPIAKYDNEPTTTMNKFTYYVLEIGKVSYIKRVIGLAGDHVIIQDGKVYVNGEVLEESYLQNSVITEASVFNNITVPEGYVFVLGDNREVSRDSRVFGCVPLDKIESKVLLRVWPLNKIEMFN